MPWQSSLELPWKYCEGLIATEHWGIMLFRVQNAKQPIAQNRFLSLPLELSEMNSFRNAFLWSDFSAVLIFLTVDVRVPYLINLHPKKLFLPCHCRISAVCVDESEAALEAKVSVVLVCFHFLGHKAQFQHVWGRRKRAVVKHWTVALHVFLTLTLHLTHEHTCPGHQGVSSKYQFCIGLIGSINMNYSSSSLAF